MGISFCERDGADVPTRAGHVLFSRGEVVSVEIVTESATTFLNGNLFQVLDEAQTVLDEENGAFTLKGETSRIVRPYPPLALKELIVNALAHRDYARNEPVLIEVTDNAIRVESPGGVVDGVDIARLGERGVKGYRNPVIADVLYGAGAMEKEGSGLADVISLSSEIGGSVSLATTEENSRFIAVIRPRPERPDELTRTAQVTLGQQRFLSNVVPVTVKAERVFAGLTSVNGYRDVRERHRGQTLPPFVLFEGQLVSFSNLNDETNPLSRDVIGTAEEHEVADFFDNDPRQRLLVQLLNAGLVAHAENLGLIVRGGDQRIYFPDDQGEPRVVTYRARVRRATRKVTKPIRSQSNGQIRYWEHEAIGYRFRRFGAEWGLMLVPGWLFTHDGERTILTGPKVGPLTTRRAAHDYNPQVANDLVFWVAVLTGGQPRRMLDDGTSAIELGSRLVSLELSNAPAAPGADDVAAMDTEEIEEVHDGLAAIASGFDDE
jgi:hypothetical protein